MRRVLVGMALLALFVGLMIPTAMAEEIEPLMPIEGTLAKVSAGGALHVPEHVIESNTEPALYVSQDGLLFAPIPRSPQGRATVFATGGYLGARRNFADLKGWIKTARQTFESGNVDRERFPNLTAYVNYEVANWFQEPDGMQTRSARIKRQAEEAPIGPMWRGQIPFGSPAPLQQPMVICGPKGEVWDTVWACVCSSGHTPYPYPTDGVAPAASDGECTDCEAADCDPTPNDCCAYGF